MNQEKIIDLFTNDSQRTQKFTFKLKIKDEFLYFDYTKTNIKAMKLSEMFKNFFALKRKNLMFEKEIVNYTEGRKVLHVSLRNKNVLDLLEQMNDENEKVDELKMKVKDAQKEITGKNQKKSENKEIKENKKINELNEKLGSEEKMVFEELLKMKEFSRKFENGELKGCTNKKLKTIVSIGIGGSDLGPRVVTEALDFYKKDGVDVHFIANIDPTETFKIFDKINIEETLFIVISKTFTTQETIANAKLALKLISEKMKFNEKEIANKHFVAVSANKNEVLKFGIQNSFDMWDFVGGRYSLWSAVGLPIILFIGFDNFCRLLRGASLMDEHFENSDNHENLPIIQAVVEIFYSKMQYNNKCIVAYDEYLKNIYLYLQQSEMESNGKSATLDGLANYDTGMLIWGGVGTSTQHSFFQLLHQGTRKVLLEFLLPLQPLKDEKVSDFSHFEMLFANCLAQSRALMVGSDNPEANRHFSGNRPSITICYSKLTPEILGALIAFYEHKIYIQGLYWKINSFDQFGVELGKKLAKEILLAMQEKKNDFDESTKEILKLRDNVLNRKKE